MNLVKDFHSKLWLGAHLRLLDSSLLEGACARVVGTIVSVLTPVALVGTTHT